MPVNADQSAQIAIEILKWGIGGAVLVVIFWKFIPTLFDFLSQQREQSREARADGTVLAILERVERLENDQRTLQSALGEMRVAVGVSQAILVRIEAQLCASHKGAS